jgi:hypothetical protein
MRSRSPSTQRASASIWAASRVVDALGVLARLGQRFGGALDVGLVVGQHVEVAAHHMAQRELGIGLEGCAEMAGGIRAILQIGLRGAVEGIDRCP